MKVNINRETKVVLTKKGAEIMNEYIKTDYAVSMLSDKQLIAVFGKSSFKENDIYKAPLWEIMHIFGGSIDMGCDIPFVDNDIDIIA